MSSPIRELTQRVWFDDEQRLVPVAFFDFEALDDPRIDDAREKVILSEQARRVAIKHMRRNGCGRRGLPKEVVATMHADYRRLQSLAKVAKIYNRTRQSVWDLFRRHKLPLASRNFHARILFDGKYWTPGKGGYYRETTKRFCPQKLHHAIWEKRTGRKVPKGWRVSFRDGDNTNFQSSNLICLPIQEITLFHYRRRFRERAAWNKEERREFWKAHYRDLAARKAAAFVSRGLRTDGLPRRRKAA